MVSMMVWDGMIGVVHGDGGGYEGTDSTSSPGRGGGVELDGG